MRHGDRFLIQLNRIMKLLHYFGLKVKIPGRNKNKRSTSNERLTSFDREVRPSFVRHSISTHRYLSSGEFLDLSKSFSLSESSDTMEQIFKKNDFCQWLISNGHVENDSEARNYCEELETRKQIICVNRSENTDQNNQWYAFTK